MRVILLEERREGLRERARAGEGRPGVEEVPRRLHLPIARLGPPAADSRAAAAK